MKTLLTTVFFAFSISILIAGPGYDVSYRQTADNIHELQFDIGDYRVETVILNGEAFTRVHFDGGVATNRKGFAELPFIHASVMIDGLKDVQIRITPGPYDEILLEQPCVPSRGVIYRDTDPSTVPYVIDPKSLTGKWFPENLAENTDPYILKDIRGTNVYVYPFQYNAKDKLLRIYKSVTVEVIENGTSNTNPL